MKQYTTKVTLRNGNPFSGDDSPIVLTTQDAYQQAVAGGDILTKYTNDGQEMLLFIPRHAICKLEFAVTNTESAPVTDAFCE